MKTRGLLVLGALVVALAISWRLVLGALALLVLVVLIRSLARGSTEGRALVVRVLAGGPIGERIVIDGSIEGHTEDAIRTFVGNLDLAPGAVLWVTPDGTVHGNHRVPDHLQQRFAEFIVKR